MSALLDRLSSALGAMMTVIVEDDGALTVTHDGMVASVRVVTIGEGLDMVSLTQPLAWDLPVNAKTRERVAEQASKTLLGTVALVEKSEIGTALPANGASKAGGSRKSAVQRTADVMLRYNFPGNGLTDDALLTLVLMVLGGGADVRRALIA
ncbi:MAG: hypothetical protein ACSLE6_10960 [Mycobacterium sp.]